jgi:hypothetical protein
MKTNAVRRGRGRHHQRGAALRLEQARTDGRLSAWLWFPSEGGCRTVAVLWLAAAVLLAGTPFGQAAGGEPRSAPAPVAASNALARHLAQLTNQVPRGFTIIEQTPFVVIGDEAAEIVWHRATNTVKWAVDKLKQDYFQRDPLETIDIWLFRDTASYTNYAHRLFNETPTTPFGYYSAAHHALVMNIGTGGGTLVHEIVHPFMQANFPECPAWFNEGLASLYEASMEKNGHLQGLVNWRFIGLEQAIKDHKTISFQQLTGTSDAEFYGQGASYNQYYGQARYLCYYLQEKGLLVKFYREFVANAKRDPTGYATLQRVLGETDMAKFKEKWEKFILALRSN